MARPYWRRWTFWVIQVPVLCLVMPPFFLITLLHYLGFLTTQLMHLYVLEPLEMLCWGILVYSSRFAIWLAGEGEDYER